jgi:hypothetical protein
VKFSVEAFGRRFKVSVAKTQPAPQSPPPAVPWEPSPSGSTCGDLERPASGDYDTRPPIGFAVRGPS